MEAWAWASDAHDLTTFEDGRLTIDEDVAAILLDDERAEFLGGQFVHAVVASMDWGGMADFFRTGQPIGERPDRYRAAIERLTRQDIAVFFQEVLAALPQLVADLSRGGRVVDVHCGGGRWLVAMARRFPALELVGVEFEADSVARARATIESEGLSDRIEIRQAQGDRIRATSGNTTSPTSSTPSTSSTTPRACSRPRGPPCDRAAACSSSTGRCRPARTSSGPGTARSSPASSSTSCTRARRSRRASSSWPGSRTAGLPAPSTIDLPSGAAVFLAERPA